MPDAGPAGGFDRRVIGDAYDRVAAEYAAKFAGDLDGLPLDRELLDSIWRQAPGGGPVLDIGCGPAQAGAYLAARGARVLGMDIAPGMLAAASGRQAGLRRAGLLGLVAGDMRALPTEGTGEFATANPQITGTRYAGAEFRQALAAASFLVGSVRRRDPLPDEMQSARIYVAAVAGGDA
jgi:SAM-dependent methyltransferase